MTDDAQPTTERGQEPQAPAKRPGCKALGRLSGWLNSPIVRKELRGRMRGWRAPVILTVQLVVMSCFASLVYLVVAESTQSARGGAIGQTMGQTLFYSTYLLLLVLTVFLSPAFTAGTISGERERKTLDLLITTLLSTRSLVLGKLVSALAYIVLLILVALPIQSLALMFGGVVFAEMAIGTLLLAVTALVAGAAGMFISSLTRSTIASTVLTYAAILIFTVGLPIVVVIVAGFGTTLVDQVINNLDWAPLAVLVYAGGFLLSTNPFAVAVATKLVEQEQGTLFFFTVQLPSAQGPSHTIPLVSPWIVYVLLYALLSVVLIAASVGILRRRRG